MGITAMRGADELRGRTAGSNDGAVRYDETKLLDRIQMRISYLNADLLTGIVSEEFGYSSVSAVDCEHLLEDLMGPP